MKKYIYLVVLALALPFVALCDSKINAQGPMVTQRCKAVEFDAVSVSSGIELILKNAPQTDVTITCAENIHQYVEVAKKGSTLVIRMKPNLRFGNRGKIVARVSAPMLTALTASSGSIVSTDGTFATPNDLNISTGSGAIMKGALEAGNIHLDTGSGSISEARITANGNFSLDAGSGAIVKGEIFCRNISIDVSSGAIIKFSGKGDSFTVEGSSGCIINCYGFTCSSVTGTMSSGSIGEFTTTGSNNVKTSSGAICRVKQP